MGKTLNDLKDQPVESITLGFVEDAIKLTNSSYIREKIAYNFIKKGWIDLETMQYTKAFKSFNRALKIFIKREDSDGYLLSNHGIASTYTLCCEYGKALEIYFDILNRLETKNTDLRFITLKDIAMTYYKWGSYTESIYYLKIAMNIIRSDKSTFRKIYINYNMGKTYLKLGKNTKAQEVLFTTLTICDANKINYKISDSLTLLGNIFRKQQDYARSESFHIRSLQYAKSSRDYKSHIEVLLNMGAMCYYAGDYKKGIKLITSALEEIHHIEDKYLILIKAYHYLFLMNKDLGDNEEALKHLQKSVVIKEDEKQRICILQYKLLHIQMKFSIKPESFIIKKSYNGELSEKEEEEIIEIAKAIFENLSNILSFSSLSVYIPQSKKEELLQTTIEDNDKIKTKIIDGRGTPALLVINNNKEIIIYDRERSDSEYSYNKNKLTKDMESFMILPIKRGNSVVGAVSIENTEKSKYTQFDLNILKTISAYMSLSIENMKIKNEVDSLNTLMDSDTIIIESKDLNKTVSQRDRESGLPKKALFTELLDQSIKETKRDNGKIAVLTIIVDLEFEKNDSFLSEDLVIGEHTITQRIKKSLRSEDILGKESDDTYLLTLKMDSIRGLRAIAKKLVALVRIPIFTENQKIQPKIKVGIAIYPDSYLTSDELIDRSKKCAYKILKENSSGYEFSDSIHNITSID